RDEFPILGRKTYLNSCSLGALSKRSMENMAQFMEMWNEWGAHAWYEIWMGEIAKVRQKFADIIGAQVHEVAIAPNVSTALSSIASAFDYSKRNKVLMADMDFPTLAYQWLVKERLGVQCEFVESPDRVYVPPELFAEKIDEQTALFPIYSPPSPAGLDMPSNSSLRQESLHSGPMPHESSWERPQLLPFTRPMGD